MNIIGGIAAGILCLTIAFAVQAIFVWVTAKIVRLDCTFAQAAVVAFICALLLMVPKVGLLLSCIAFFILFTKWLRADFTEAFLAFLVNCMLEFLLIFIGVA
jgi:hypothetical protein